MFALKADRDRSVSEAGTARSSVLSRWLRRRMRGVSRLTIDDLPAPRYGATFASALLLSGALVYGCVEGGHSDTVVSFVTARSGFAIEDVRVTGNRETSEIDVLQQVGLDGWTSMIGFDVAAARARIAELPWVENVSVRKIYPTSVEIDIVERQALALWQRDNQVQVIDEKGEVIAPFSGGRMSALPLVIGVGADKSGSEIVSSIAEYPDLASRVRAYIRIADRRWDLRLDNGVTVKLPEDGLGNALAELQSLQGEFDILNRSVEAVDLRLSDRISVAMTPDAATDHDKAVKDLIARAKKGARI